MTGWPEELVAGRVAVGPGDVGRRHQPGDLGGDRPSR
jgi:hypothetical protein